MQEHTKKETQQEIRNVSRGAAPVHIVQGPRLGASTSESLREAQLNLVRAEQNLYNLVQANQGTNGSQFGSSAGFGYPAATGFPVGYAGPSFTPGFTAPGTFSAPTGLGLGTIPGFNPWGPTPHAAASPWSTWQNAMPGAPGSLQYGTGVLQSVWPSSPGTFAGGMASRTPACDIVDEGKQFVCQLELPGVKADQVELLVFERAIVINAMRETEGDVTNLVQSERGNATQQRAITLPNEIQSGSAKATLSNGILTIVLPKAHPTDGPRRVAVQG